MCYSSSLSSHSFLPVSAVGSIPPFETQPCRSECKVAGIGSKNFASGSLGVIVSGATLIFFRRLFTSESAPNIWYCSFHSQYSQGQVSEVEMGMNPIAV